MSAKVTQLVSGGTGTEPEGRAPDLHVQLSCAKIQVLEHHPALGEALISVTIKIYFALQCKQYCLYALGQLKCISVRSW